MNMEEAIELVRAHSRAAITHYKAVNEPGRRSGKLAAEREHKTARKLLESITHEQPTEREVERALE